MDPEPEDEPAGTDGGAEPAELEDFVSPHLVCPISHRIMEAPVLSPSGHSYDRSSILAWLQRRPVDPLSLTPLLASALYPNRALRSEIQDQLERVAASAVQRGDERVAAAARARLATVQGARQEPAVRAAESKHRLERQIGRCISWATWWGLLAWEQVLVVATSLGALLCLAVDATESFRGLRAEHGAVMDSATPRPPLLAAFVRLALLPVSAPEHWGWAGRCAITALRGTLLLPLGHFCLAVSAGALLSFARFVHRCSEIRPVEVERAWQSPRFLNVLHAFYGITGAASFGLFVRLYWDRRIRPGRLTA